MPEQPLLLSLRTRVVDLGSDTFGNPIFQKDLQNWPFSPIISVLSCFATSSKIGPDFSNIVFFKLNLQKNNSYKKCAPKLLFFNKKKSERFG